MSLHKLHKFALVQHRPTIFFAALISILHFGYGCLRVKRIFDQPYLFMAGTLYESNFKVVIFDVLVCHYLVFKSIMEL